MLKGLNKFIEEFESQNDQKINTNLDDSSKENPTMNDENEINDDNMTNITKLECFDNVEKERIQKI